MSDHSQDPRYAAAVELEEQIQALDRALLSLSRAKKADPLRASISEWLRELIAEGKRIGMLDAGGLYVFASTEEWYEATRSAA